MEALKTRCRNISIPNRFQSLIKKHLLGAFKCSNSLIEAHFKVLKYNYLYKMPIANRSDLLKTMAWVHNDFDNRPHISLNGLTPNESQENYVLDIDSLKAKKKSASEERKRFNFKNRCVACAA